MLVAGLSAATTTAQQKTVVLTRLIREIEAVSLDLVILAMNEANADSARRMFERCNRYGFHDEGDLDPRIVAFYEQLRISFPDHPPYDDAPCWSSRSDPAIDKIMES